MVKVTKSKSSDNETRDRIIDAAERVFSQKGFSGATISEIFDDAGSNRGLLSYYFKNKENLFGVTVDRKFDEFKARFFAAFDHAPRTPAGILTVEEFCRTYIGFMLDLAHDPDNGWQHYIKLLAVANSIYEHDALSPQLNRFDFIIDTSVSYLSATLPATSTYKIRECLLYLESSISTLIVSDRLWLQRIQEVEAFDYQARVNGMASFFAAAIAVHCI